MKNSDKERVRVTLRQYEAFLKTVECAGVSAAAQALGVSQSALTQLLALMQAAFRCWCATAAACI